MTMIKIKIMRMVSTGLMMTTTAVRMITMISGDDGADNAIMIMLMKAMMLKMVKLLHYTTLHYITLHYTTASKHRLCSKPSAASVPPSRPPRIVLYCH